MAAVDQGRDPFGVSVSTVKVESGLGKEVYLFHVRVTFDGITLDLKPSGTQGWADKHASPVSFPAATVTEMAYREPKWWKKAIGVDSNAVVQSEAVATIYGIHRSDYDRLYSAWQETKTSRGPT